MVNTLPHLLPHLKDVNILKDQPRMSEVGAGRSLKQEQIYIFYVTLLELQKVLEKTMAKAGLPRDLSKVLEEAESHNLELIKFFFKHLVRTDREENAESILDQKDRRSFARHFGFLRQVFPFL